MPVTDLKTIDALWSHFSGGRYGFAIQRKLWVAQKRNWAKFFKKNRLDDGREWGLSQVSERVFMASGRGADTCH